jgi:hypothetical protein
MIRRSVISGLGVGLLFSLVALYPVFSILVFPRVLDIQWPPWPEAVRSLSLVGIGVIGVLVFSLIGTLAALRSRATNVLEGFQAGGISGAIVGLVFYAIVLSATTSLAASAQVWRQVPMHDTELPPDVVLTLARQLTWGMINELSICLLVGGLVGGIEGAIVGRLRRDQETPSLTLLEALLDPHPRRRWFAGQDQVWRAGLIAGAISGIVLGYWITIGFLDDMQNEWPRLQEVIGEQVDAATNLIFSDAVAILVSPFFVLALIGTGALAILLLKDPPRRFLSRMHATMIAGITASVPVYLSVARNARFYSGLARYMVRDWMETKVDIDPAMIPYLRAFVDNPQMSVPVFYLVPLSILGGVLLVAVIWSLGQAIVYGSLMPLLLRRPADRAARIARTLKAEPNSLLPQLYGLFTRDPQAMHVLPHMAFSYPDTDIAQIAAAYHTMDDQPDRASNAVAIISRGVAEHEEWRWRAEIGELYRVLRDGLTAKTLGQVAAIKPLPQDVTSSLPLLLSKSCDGIGRILSELQKEQRVEELSAKTIFLNNAQAAILDLRRYIAEEERPGPEHHLKGEKKGTYPEINVLHLLLDRWQDLVLSATKDLQGRADLRSGLKTDRAKFMKRVHQSIVIANHGLNVAQNVRFQADDGDGYRVIEGAEQTFEIIGPEESREVEFWLEPEGVQRLRLAWHLTYDDAIDDNRHVEFADMFEIEQSGSDRPFQRIFPIPYVTGTPLRSGEMFVGRQDVFDFVKENLLGAYQNNVIVLHGQRRTGKTSILYRLQEVMAETHIAVLVDMQGKAARGTADFLYALSDDIAYTLEDHEIYVELPEREEYESSPEFTFRSRFLRAAIEQMDSRNLLLMFDEFEELQKRVEDGKLEPEIFPYLRNLMQHEPRVDFVFSGTHKLEELGAEYWSILFNIAAYKRITFLEPDEVRRLVTEPVAPAGVEYDPLAVERILQVSAGHPYFTQVVCHEMVAYHNETERNYLTVTCVDRALEHILERGEAHFKYIWTGASLDEQKVMLALTDLLPDADTTTTPGRVEEELSRKGFTLKDGTVLDVLTHLQAQDIVTRSGPQSTLYRFKIDLIRRWIDATRPVVQ